MVILRAQLKRVVFLQFIEMDLLMDLLKPIHTKVAQCQDCYKCLRQCEVKAIKIQDSHAMIIPKLCILCGNCVRVCPVGAKRIRDDINRARLLIKTKNKVIVSLAPSYISEFDDVSTDILIGAFKALGFWGVSETALGAEEVSANAAAMFADIDKGILISSACPTVVEFIKKYHPDQARNVTNMLSPALTHCKILRQTYGDDTGIVFVGPCIAKKTESDINGDLMNVALTYKEVRQWLESARIDLAAIRTCNDDKFIPHDSKEGALYPVDGGMIAGMESNCRIDDSRFMAFSGIANISDALQNLKDVAGDRKLFLELLACEGGCINGPASEITGSSVIKRCRVIDNATFAERSWPRKAEFDISSEWQIDTVKESTHDPKNIRIALEKVGKYAPEDELNCGSCGYDSCLAFANAFLDGKAEVDMCVGYMRKLAAKKADAVISAMPSGVVIVDENFRIVESNRRFAEIIGQDVLSVYEVCPELKGAAIEKIVPLQGLFERILYGGADQIEKDIKLNDGRIVHVSLFIIEAGRLVGGIIQDITEPAIQKERIVNKARDVMKRNLETVQKIAFLLGENAADSGVILKSIVNSFSADTYDGDNSNAK